MPARRLTTDEKQQRDHELLEILSNYGDEWTSADAVTSTYNNRHELGRDGLSAVGVGRILARLADAGRCERQLGYMSYYRARRSA